MEVFLYKEDKIMKKILLALILCFTLTAQAFALDAYTERIRPYEVKGLTVFGADDDIDATAELITELDTTYVQLAAEDQIEILSATTDITQYVTVTGIDNNGKRISETNLLTGTTEVLSTATFRYIDQVSVDKECAGVITIRRETNTFITSIPIGQLQATMVQHFNGEKKSYLEAWRASVTSTTGSVLFQLRWYPDDADCLDPTDGFLLVDEIQLTNVLSTQQHSLHRTYLPAGGWLAVYGTGGSANSDGSVTVWGFDSAN